VAQPLCAGTSRSAYEDGSRSGVFGPQPVLRAGARETDVKNTLSEVFTFGIFL